METCWICLRKSSSLKPLFSEKNSLACRINQIFKLETEIEKLESQSQNICFDCLTDLHHAFKFYENVSFAQHRLTMEQESNKIQAKIDKEKEKVVHNEEKNEQNLQENVINFSLEDKNEEEMLMEVLQETRDEIFNETEYIVQKHEQEVCEEISPETENPCIQQEKIVFTTEIIKQPTVDPPPYISIHSKFYSCDICGKSYDKKASFTYHMKSQHTEQKEFQCPICGKEFPVKVDFTRHQRIHTKEKRFTCSVCGKSFTDRSTHLKHEKIHLGVKPFKCELCQKSFTHKFVLENHYFVHTGEKNFPCTECNKRFSRKIKLKEHFMRIHKRTFSIKDEEKLKMLQGTLVQNSEL